jgi:hypothetical protein
VVSATRHPTYCSQRGDVEANLGTFLGLKLWDNSISQQSTDGDSTGKLTKSPRVGRKPWEWRPERKNIGSLSAEIYKTGLTGETENQNKKISSVLDSKLIF